MIRHGAGAIPVWTVRMVSMQLDANDTPLRTASLIEVGLTVARSRS